MSANPVIREHVRMRDETFVRNKDYQQWPIGQQVRRWLDALRWEDASANTLDAYELVGAWLADEFRYLDGLQGFPAGQEGIGMLRYFLEKNWGEASAETRRQRQSALSSLFQWAVEEEIVEVNLVRKIRRPPKGDRRREAHARAAMVQLVLAQETVRDRCCVQLLVRLGLRKDELRRLQIRDVNLETNMVRVQGKGGKVRALPIGTLETLRRDLAFHVATEQRQPAEYLLYPKEDRARPMDRSSVHRWFKRCLANAGLSNFPMHELRHTAADEFYRLTGDIVLAAMLLGHESVASTQVYLHPSTDRLADGLRQTEAAWREALNEVTEEVSR